MRTQARTVHQRLGVVGLALAHVSWQGHGLLALVLLLRMLVLRLWQALV